MLDLKDQYQKEIRSKLQEKFKYKNVMCIPKLTKIVISMGIADITKDKNAIQDAKQELAMLSGQLPIETKARVSISNFKLREGQTLGLKVTLRGKRMYDFMLRFFHIVSPRIRDFRGFKRAADGRGNVSIGLEDQQMFPEIDLDNVKRTQGMNINFVTTANTDEEGMALMEMLGLPLKKAKAS